MGLSVVVIGRDSERTLPECLRAFCTFAEEVNQSIDVELLYVDSASADASIAVAKLALTGSRLSWKILSVDSSRQSAALGRYIGMQEASHNDLLFVDSDMVVDRAWLTNALAQRGHRILSGQRYEVFLSSDTCWIWDRQYYKAADLGRVSRPAGLFLLFDAHRTAARFTPYLRSEEEADFVAQDRLLHGDVYRTSEVAFVHLNRKQRSISKRLYANLSGMPAMSNYICGRIEAVRRGDYLVLFRSSHFYEVGALGSLMLYGGLAFCSWTLLAITAVLIALAARKGSVAYRSIVFPLELLFGLYHMLHNKSNYQPRFTTVASGYAFTATEGD